jgi:hypothetical protein
LNLETFLEHFFRSLPLKNTKTTYFQFSAPGALHAGRTNKQGGASFDQI